VNAKVGDRIVVLPTTSGVRREGEILAVGENGHPPFRVRWSDDNHESVIYPGSDTEVLESAPQSGALTSSAETDSDAH
jgi:Domain of unknown function (DUF1918)